MPEKIGAIDVGGTSVKHAVWDGSGLVDKFSFKTPRTLDEFYSGMASVVSQMRDRHKIAGAGFSIPGAVDDKSGVIGGLSALPYIHGFDIQTDLSRRLGLPVSMENDANCAALAEVRHGAAKDLRNVLLIVIGTGVGGSVVIGGKIHRGQHLHGGEFGLMFMDDTHNLSDLGSTVNMAKRYNDRLGTGHSGREIFELAAKGDKAAIEEAEIFYHNLAKGIFNLQYAFDPEKIIIGGGVSQADFLIPEINRRIKKLLAQVKTAEIMPEIAVSHFKNDANLIGAAINFIEKQNTKAN
jgi:predicted NBD/HSP70 family sugar kinase